MIRCLRGRISQTIKCGRHCYSVQLISQIQTVCKLEFTKISIDELPLLGPPACTEPVAEPIQNAGNHIGSADNGAELDQKLEDCHAIGVDIDDHPADAVVEVHGRHVAHLGVVVARRVLERLSVREQDRVLVDSGHHVQVVVRHPPMPRSLRRCPQFLCLGQTTKLGFWVAGFYVLKCIGAPEIEIVYFVAGVQSQEHSIDHEPCVKILISVAGDVEIAWNFLDSKRAYEPAAPFPLKGLFGYFQLPQGIGLMEYFEAPLLQEVAIFIEPPLGDGSYIGVMRHQHIHNIERDDLAGQSGELNVDVDAAQQAKYVIYSRVIGSSGLSSAFIQGYRNEYVQKYTSVLIRQIVKIEMQPPTFVPYERS